MKREVGRREAQRRAVVRMEGVRRQMAAIVVAHFVVIGVIGALSQERRAKRIGIEIVVRALTEEQMRKRRTVVVVVLI